MVISREDRLDILELYARYCYFADDGEADRWAGLFTPDGRIAYGPGGSVPPFEHRGTAELASYMRSVHEVRGRKRATRHHMFNMVIEGTETGASSRMLPAIHQGGRPTAAGAADRRPLC